MNQDIETLIRLKKKPAASNGNLTIKIMKIAGSLSLAWLLVGLFRYDVHVIDGRLLVRYDRLSGIVQTYDMVSKQWE